MSILRLVALEIWHRKLSFLIGLLAVTTAVAYAVCSLTLIRAHQTHSERRVAKLDDEIRKITKAMGFNINVLPAEMNLSDFFASDFAGQTLPQEYVHRLADSEFVKSVRHLRPALLRKIEWPEQSRPVVLMGVAGVVPLTHSKNPKKPLAAAVPDGTINIGFELARQLGFSKGDNVLFFGHALTVHQVYDARGSIDDITVYVDLALAQQILDLPNRITLIQALECNCASIDRLAEIRTEISQVLGEEVQVHEVATQAIARAEARNVVQAEGQRTLVAMQNRALIQMVVLSVAGILLVGLLTLTNVRERRAEIGVLRALGAKTATILTLFMTKSLVTGVVGAVMGVAIGFGLATSLESANQAANETPFGWHELVWPAMMLSVVVLTPLLTLVASWFPTLQAAGQDPARILTTD